MKLKISLIVIIIMLLLLQAFPDKGRAGGFLSSHWVFAAENDDDDPVDDDDMDRKPGLSRRKNPINYLPDDPEVKKLKLQAMALAEEFTRLIAERSLLQIQLTELEKNESELKHLRLKYQLRYFILRDELMQKYMGKHDVMKLLVRHDGEMMHIEDLIIQEERIDCYHTVFERKHRAMEEFHWSLIDNKHSLIGEYLADSDVKKDKAQFITLYNETIRDYRRIIEDNREIMKETKEIIEAKKKREVILKQIVEEQKRLCSELEKAK